MPEIAHTKTFQNLANDPMPSYARTQRMRECPQPRPSLIDSTRMPELSTKRERSAQLNILLLPLAMAVKYKEVICRHSAPASCSCLSHTVSMIQALPPGANASRTLLRMLTTCSSEKQSKN